jgi:flagellar basal-body rod protein FlgC
MEYSPNHPMADEDGYIFRPNVNVVEEMANMMDASRTYETNIEVMNTTKQILLKTIQMGK